MQPRPEPPSDGGAAPYNDAMALLDAFHRGDEAEGMRLVRSGACVERSHFEAWLNKIRRGILEERLAESAALREVLRAKEREYVAVLEEAAADRALWDHGPPAPEDMFDALAYHPRGAIYSEVAKGWREDRREERREDRREDRSVKRRVDDSSASASADSAASAASADSEYSAPSPEPSPEPLPAPSPAHSPAPAAGVEKDA